MHSDLKLHFFFSMKIDDLGYDLYSILVRHFKKTVTMERQNVIFKATFISSDEQKCPAEGSPAWVISDSLTEVLFLKRWIPGMFTGAGDSLLHWTRQLPCC